MAEQTMAAERAESLYLDHKQKVERKARWE